MKKLIFLSIFTFVFSVISFSQEYGWIDISANLPVEADLSDIFFVSDNEGWITSSSQAKIYHTSDGGQTFEIQTTQFSTQTLYMISEDEGYSGGASGRVYRTTDGGENWIAIGTIATTLTDMDFATATLGYACGNGGAVFSITSQGVTNLNTGQAIPFSGISTPSVNKVYVCGGGSIMVYSGEEWIFQSGPAGSYNDLFFLNDQKGWVVGDSGLLGHTEDGGEDWTRQTNPDSNSLYRVFFLNQNEGWAIGAQGSILKTTNGGDTWVLDVEGSTLAGTKFLRGLHFTSATNGYVVGNGKTLLKYGEITNSVEEIESIQFEIYPNPTQNIIQIHCSEFKTENGIIEILSLDGKKIMEKEIETETEDIELDLSNLKTGMYFCKVSTDKKSSTKKLKIE